MTRVEKILEGIAKSGRVAGAYLFLGPIDAGKKETAVKFADLLGAARYDRLTIVPEGASLKIEQIRDLQVAVRYGPAAGPYLTVIVEQADLLTDEAAAAFLKTLEEPAPGVVFILLAERADRLPATVLSRCQKVLFPEPLEEWRPREEFAPFCRDLAAAGKMGDAQLLALATRIYYERQKDRSKILELLYELAGFSRYRLGQPNKARALLDAASQVQRKVNLKVALDVLCLKLGER